MRALALSRKPVGEIVVDLCPACHGLWFDSFESLQLTPQATLALLRSVATPATAEPVAPSGPLRCPRCTDRLAETRDIQRTTRFSYWRCRHGHGRFTPFLQFMREKDFIRPLSPAEVARIRDHVGTVRCSGCGAPVDLGREPSCRYCGARIEALDPDAVRKAIDGLADVLERAPRAPPDTAIDAWIEALARRPAARRRSGINLIAEGLQALLMSLGSR